jgi:tetratricopeptide (TPR) repeat protein
MRAGKWSEAEKVLREAIFRVEESRRWRLQLALSQVLVKLGDDDNKNRTYYDEALRQVNEARRIKENNEDVWFHAGVIHFKLEDYASARRGFEECFRANSHRFDAERNIRLTSLRLREARRVNRINFWGGFLLALFCALGLGGIWLAFLTGWRGRVDRELIIFMTPVLLGLIVVGLLLPNLNKLKLPGGFEADISEAKPRDISSGPRGDIGFGSAQEAISPGPR